MPMDCAWDAGGIYALKVFGAWNDAHKGLKMGKAKNCACSRANGIAVGHRVGDPEFRRLISEIRTKSRGVHQVYVELLINRMYSKPRYFHFDSLFHACHLSVESMINLPRPSLGRHHGKFSASSSPQAPTEERMLTLLLAHSSIFSAAYVRCKLTD